MWRCSSPWLSRLTADCREEEREREWMREIAIWGRRDSEQEIKSRIH